MNNIQELISKRRGRPRIDPTKMFSYKNWYKDNKEALSIKRKARYDSDPEHRKRIVERNKAYRIRLRLQKLSEQNGQG